MTGNTTGGRQETLGNKGIKQIQGMPLLEVIQLRAGATHPPMQSGNDAEDSLHKCKKHPESLTI